MRYCGVVCGQFRFFSVHMARIALSRVKALLRARPGNTIPSISPMCAQVRRRFTQVIHMVVHSKACKHVLVPGWQAAAGQRAGACARRPTRSTRTGRLLEIINGTALSREHGCRLTTRACGQHARTGPAHPAIAWHA